MPLLRRLAHSPMQSIFCARAFSGSSRSGDQPIALLSPCPREIDDFRPRDQNCIPLPVLAWIVGVHSRGAAKPSRRFGQAARCDKQNWNPQRSCYLTCHARRKAFLDRPPPGYPESRTGVAPGPLYGNHTCNRHPGEIIGDPARHPPAFSCTINSYEK